MTLEEKIKEIHSKDISTTEKAALITKLLLQDLLLSFIKGVPDYDRLSEDSDREPQAVQDDVET